MNQEYDQKLEAAVARALKALPELPAPRTLESRVMRAIQSRLHPEAVPPFWQTWPVSLQWSALGLLLLFFAGLCFASWKLTHAEPMAFVFQRFEADLLTVGTLWNALHAVASSLLLALQQLHPGLLIGCLVAAALAYAMVLMLGTVYVRLALSGRRQNLTLLTPARTQ